MVSKVIFDASTLIDIWEKYPKDLKIFDSVWELISELINDHMICVTYTNFEEVKHKSDDAYYFYKSLNVETIVPNQEILQRALTIQKTLGLSDADIKNKLRDGVDEGDIICIATAQHNNLILVTEEKKQPTYKGNAGPSFAKYKIPKVCELISVDVECIRFLDYLQLLKETY